MAGRAKGFGGRSLWAAAAAASLAAAACGGGRTAAPEAAGDRRGAPVPAPAGHHAPGDHAPANLEAMVSDIRRATARYRDLDAARADGFVRFGDLDAPLAGEHWYRRDLAGEPFDHRRPSTLLYALIDGERVLVGVAYSVYRRPDDPAPDGFPGYEHAWHVHDLRKIGATWTEGRPVARLLVNRWLASRDPTAGGRTQLTMLHAWVWLENPDFVLADEHRALPYVRAGLPAVWAEGADLAAANGVALLGDAQCLRERRTTERIARIGRLQAATLRRACAQAAEAVRAALASRPDAAALNRVAAAAWREYQAERDRVLTPAQAARVAAWIDHPHAR